MKHINDFILEKFKLNSNNAKFNKYNKELIEDIITHFGLEKDNKINKYIEEWVTFNNVDKVFYYADKESLEEGKNAGMSDDILNNFNTDYSKNEKCQYELDKCKEVYDEDGLTIQYNKNMIAFLSDIGAVYCTNKEIDKIQN